MDNDNRDKIKPYCAKKFGVFDEFKSNIEDDIKDIKQTIQNHLPGKISEMSKQVNDKIDDLTKMVNKRPTWLFSIIITGLIGVIMFLLGLIATRFF